VLRKKPRPRLHHFGARPRQSLDRHRRANRIAIAFIPSQPDRDRRRQILHHVPQQPQLWSIAALQKHFLPPVVIEIGQRERSPVLQKIQPYRARNVGESSVAVVRIEHVALVAAPGVIGANQLIDHLPALLIFRRRPGLIGRIGHHLPPEITVQILAPLGPDSMPLAIYRSGNPS
jgi:hypothetical protein